MFAGCRRARLAAAAAGPGGTSAGCIAVAIACAQSAEHQQVVLRGVVVVRGQLLRVQQVRDVQVDQLQAGEQLQVLLDFSQPQLEGRPCTGNPKALFR